MTQRSSAVQRIDLSNDSELVNAANEILSRVRAADGVEAFSEGFTKELGRTSGHTYWASLDDGALTSLAACAPDGSAELAVDPSARRNGHGAALAGAVLAERPDAGLWAHGDLPAARALASKLSLRPTRELLVMSLDGDALEAAGGSGGTGSALPGGFEELSYPESVNRWGRDAVEHTWLDVNNDAFSWHPEQGGWDLAGLHDAMDTPWFDPEGVRMLWDTHSAGSGAESATGAREAELAGFHWTKRHSAKLGEVYVVGLSSQYRGRGLGDPLMRAGLEHLAAGGSRRVILYVEADNGPAVRRYGELGFTVAERHVVYKASEAHEA
ncbi:mycothiol synthase [Corynebacterium sp. p3-SID1145]|uniref:mycothiol synthase n=1 Tax=unclassified Corynebacterium TaxID=2624378 RepID=UPI0021AA707B|nr:MULTISPECIES: mycothiol synthase [unclassified Corynebacterium]MCT1452249.1 mycothiol synthase [Corynebacterium sp. p3-SID1145]MCT1462109.1 mycothiol synthase [Corynebacterium sp. p3-SID1140]